MMHKIFIAFIPVCFAIMSAFGQSLEVVEPDTLVADVSNTATLEAHARIRNKGNSAVSVHVKRTLLSTTAGNAHDIYFCWGANCYAPTTVISPSPEPIAFGDTNYTFKGYVAGNQADGQSIVRYTFYNSNNANDSASFVVKYNVGVVAIREQALANKDVMISNAYPNPAQQYFALNYELKNSAQTKVVLHNILGHQVVEQTLGAGNGSLRFNTGDLPAGVYFYTIVINGQNRGSKKIIIRK